MPEEVNHQNSIDKAHVDSSADNTEGEEVVSTIPVDASAASEEANISVSAQLATFDNAPADVLPAASKVLSHASNSRSTANIHPMLTGRKNEYKALFSNNTWDVVELPLEEK
ncbi:hypothetical protein V6N13_096086 [Hibiscus sabdariffa]|uniref:Uncharacterized protein n=1 Tax=Hibiscus sabdariffa TaxID=183260 RepID=A0ABR2DHV1_9ROSI